MCTALITMSTPNTSPVYCLFHVIDATLFRISTIAVTLTIGTTAAPPPIPDTIGTWVVLVDVIRLGMSAFWLSRLDVCVGLFGVTGKLVFQRRVNHFFKWECHHGRRKKEKKKKREKARPGTRKKVKKDKRD
jgi:hypothetical protein